MINIVTFFKPENKQQRIIKWSVIALLNLLGILLLSACIRNLIICEEASNHPIIVEATISVSIEDSFFSANHYYKESLSYQIGDTLYDGVFYSQGRGNSRLAEQGKVITVAVNPDNPEQLIEHMYNQCLYWASILVLSVGLVLLLYGILAEKTKVFRQPNPDYFGVAFITEVAVLSVMGIGLSLIFPNTLGFTHFLESF